MSGKLHARSNSRVCEEAARLRALEVQRVHLEVLVPRFLGLEAADIGAAKDFIAVIEPWPVQLFQCLARTRCAVAGAVAGRVL